MQIPMIPGNGDIKFYLTYSNSKGSGKSSKRKMPISNDQIILSVWKIALDNASENQALYQKKSL
jgi:hypothetical protein